MTLKRQVVTCNSNAITDRRGHVFVITVVDGLIVFLGIDKIELASSISPDAPVMRLPWKTPGVFFSESFVGRPKALGIRVQLIRGIAEGVGTGHGLSIRLRKGKPEITLQF